MRRKSVGTTQKHTTPQHIRFLFVLLTTSLCLSLFNGCVTSIEEKKTVTDTTLLVSQSGPTATIKWKTETGFLYTILYVPKRRGHSPWQPLPGAIKIRGTGGDITIQDRRPRSNTRRYRLHVERSPGRR